MGARRTCGVFHSHTFELEDGSLDRLNRRSLAFATTLAAVAGYVDAAGFLMTGGYFVSFMSGNSTRLGVAIALGTSGVLLAAGLVGAFVGGVVAGASIRRLARSRPEPFILAAITGSLALCAILHHLGQDLAAALLLSGAMGAENTIFTREGEVRVGLTYMTGALVKVGKGLTAALFGEAPLRWAPHLLLWLGLICGAVLGAIAFNRFQASALWLPVALMSVLSLLSVRIFLVEPPQQGRGAHSATQT